VQWHVCGGAFPFQNTTENNNSNEQATSTARRAGRQVVVVAARAAAERARSHRRGHLLRCGRSHYMRAPKMMLLLPIGGHVVRAA
jgi:hypothetical protein